MRFKRLRVFILKWFTRRAKRISFEDEIELRHAENKCNYCGQSFTFRQDMYAHEMLDCPLRPKLVENQTDH